VVCDVIPGAGNTMSLQSSSLDVLHPPSSKANGFVFSLDTL
jgi:hypothetical protein